MVYRAMMDPHKTAYDFSFQSATGEVLPLSQFHGKVLFIVNTASRCGFNRQYQGLEQLYKRYQDRGLVVIGVPSNDFGGQEPGTDNEIQAFCQTRFAVTFPVVKKERLKGASIHPFYGWAREVLGFGSAPKWNFHKYLVNRQGHLVDYFYSTTSVNSRRLVRVLENLLDAE